jgi:hypothetical protein
MQPEKSRPGGLVMFGGPMVVAAGSIATELSHRVVLAGEFLLDVALTDRALSRAKGLSLSAPARKSSLFSAGNIMGTPSTRQYR